MIKRLIRLIILCLTLCITLCTFVACNQSCAVIDCVITFNAQSGEVDTLTKTVTNRRKVGELPVPTNGNLKFLGWYYNGKQIEENDTFKYGKDIEVVAKWEYFITYQLWSEDNNKIIQVEVIDGNPQDKTVDSDYVISSELPAHKKVKLLNVKQDDFSFYGWTFNEKKFDGTKYAYPKDTTVEDLMIKLKNGNAEEQELRNQIIENGKVNIVATSYYVWTSAH